MLRTSQNHCGTPCRGLFGALPAIAACLVTAGCAAWSRPDYDYTGVGGVRDRPSTNWTENVRQRDRSTNPFAWSNEAKEIERNFGIE